MTTIESSGIDLTAHRINTTGEVLRNPTAALLYTHAIIRSEGSFSTCFAQPFPPHSPAAYAQLLGEKLDQHGATVWLLNTGWTGGPAEIGHRMPIDATRTLLNAALSGTLELTPSRLDPRFSFQVPRSVPGVEPSLLDPRSTWVDRNTYDRQARTLAELFIDNFARRFPDVDPDIRAAGPRADEELSQP